jgi:cbb3-type cytochrome oxidase subunit 3
MPSLAALVILVGIGFIGYLVWIFSRAHRRAR